MNDTYEMKRLGNIYGATGGSFAGMVYDINHTAATLTTMSGGNRMPLILVYEEDNAEN